VPIVVELRTERGQVVRGLDDPSGGTFDASGDFDRLLPDDGMLLRYIDEYGDTVFNRLQMNDLIRDVDRLAARADLEPIERPGSRPPTPNRGDVPRRDPSVRLVHRRLAPFNGHIPRTSAEDGARGAARRPGAGEAGAT